MNNEIKKIAVARNAKFKSTKEYATQSVHLMLLFFLREIFIFLYIFLRVPSKKCDPLETRFSKVEPPNSRLLQSQRNEIRISSRDC